MLNVLSGWTFWDNCPWEHGSSLWRRHPGLLSIRPLLIWDAALEMLALPLEMLSPILIWARWTFGCGAQAPRVSICYCNHPCTYLSPEKYLSHLIAEWGTGLLLLVYIFLHQLVTASCSVLEFCRRYYLHTRHIHTILRSVKILCLFWFLVIEIPDFFLLRGWHTVMSVQWIHFFISSGVSLVFLLFSMNPKLVKKIIILINGMILICRSGQIRSLISVLTLLVSYSFNAG